MDWFETKKFENTLHTLDTRRDLLKHTIDLDAIKENLREKYEELNQRTAVIIVSI